MQACETLALWRGADNELTMAVNVSAKQLLRADLAASVTDLCDRFQLKPQNLTLEVTERQLVDLVGYGSLTYLRTLPVHTVKIDQSLVAEGVEEQAVADRLIELGCAHAQGWLFGYPVPSGQLRTAGG